MTGKTGNKVVPTSTVLQARLVLFQPSQRPRNVCGDWMQTPYGRCRVNGRLGQRHADVLESIMYVAERRRDIEDGGIELLVDPAALRRSLSDNQYSYQGIQDLLADLRAASIEIVTPEMEATGDRIIGGLIDHAIPSQMTRPDPLGGERQMWRVRLGVALVLLLDKDLSLYYQPMPIARLQHGISQAVARHILSHKHQPAGGWHMDTLLYAVCGNDAENQTIRNGRRRLKQDAEKLAEIGIEITEQNRVKRATAAR